MLALSNKIIVKRDKAPEEKGILLSATPKPKPPTGEIISIGSKVEELKVGDRIQFNLNYSAKLHESNDADEFLVLNQDNVLCKY